MLRSILAGVYVAVGIIVANSHQYFHHVHNIQGVVSAALAVILWPKSSTERLAGRPTATSAIAPSIAPPAGTTPPDTVQAWLAWTPGGW